MEKCDKILAGLETMARSEGHKLEISTTRNSAGQWLILFRVGRAQVYTTLTNFSKHPEVVLEPMGEEMIKQVKGLI